MSSVQHVKNGSHHVAATSSSNTTQPSANLDVYRGYISTAIQIFSSEMQGIDPSWILAIIMVETEGGTNVANSSINGMGPMQILPSTAVELLKGMTDTQLTTLVNTGFSNALINQIKKVKILDEACRHCATKAEVNAKTAQYNTAFQAAVTLAKSEIKKPKQNIIVGSYYVGHLYRDNGYSISRAIAAYNPGSDGYYSLVSQARKRLRV